MDFMFHADDALTAAPLNPREKLNATAVCSTLAGQIAVINTRARHRMGAKGAAAAAEMRVFKELSFMIMTNDFKPEDATQKETYAFYNLERFSFDAPVFSLAVGCFMHEMLSSFDFGRISSVNLEAV